MKRFKCSLGMCFPHKFWVKEWQTYHNKTHDDVRCKQKYTFERILPPVSYVYDDLLYHRSFACLTPRSDALVVKNWLACHVCVDGGLIRYRFTNYMHDWRYPQGRCDSLIFDKKDLWFVEFKMNTTTSLDDQLWKDMKGGMTQLKDFIYNLRYMMDKKRTPLYRYFRLSHQHCVICMNKYPKMSTSRNNHLENFRLATGMKLLRQTVIP